jgi:hypothetical protein
MNQASAAKLARTAKPSKVTIPMAKQGPMVEAEPTIEQIRQRAYELYRSRGDRTGTALQDWLEAERELRNKHS